MFDIILWTSPISFIVFIMKHVKIILNITVIEKLAMIAIVNMSNSFIIVPLVFVFYY